MKLHIPEITTIGGHEIQIVYDEKVDEYADCFGLYDSSTDKITLNPGVSNAQLEETYIHELIEACNKLFDLKMDHQTIQTLGVGMHQALTTGRGVK